MTQIFELPGTGPVYTRLHLFVKKMIESGAYKAGDYLPSAREAAASFGINPNTVVRAYRSLEEEGYVVAVDRKGYAVLPREGKPTRMDTLRHFLDEVMDRGYTKEEIVSLLLGKESEG